MANQMSENVQQEAPNGLPYSVNQELNSIVAELRPPSMIRVAYQGRGQQFLYPQPEISATQSKAAAMDRVRAKMVHVGLDTPRFIHWGRGVLWEMTVGLATIRSSVLDDIESTNSPRRVVITCYERSPELTAIINQHAILGAAEPFMFQHGDTVTGSLDDRVVVVSYKLDKKAVGKLILCALGFSTLLGVILGILTLDVAVGFSVFAGMGTLANALLGVVVWLTR